MNPKPSASKECFLKGLRERPVELYVVVPSALVLTSHLGRDW
jgi:hypothetical protein